MQKGECCCNLRVSHWFGCPRGELVIEEMSGASLHHHPRRVLDMDSYGAYGILATVALVLFTWSYGRKHNERPSLRSVAIVVLGDIGRSPRMMYHAESFVNNDFDTYLIGYNGGWIAQVYYQHAKHSVARFNSYTIAFAKSSHSDAVSLGIASTFQNPPVYRSCTHQGLASNIDHPRGPTCANSTSTGVHSGSGPFS